MQRCVFIDYFVLVESIKINQSQGTKIVLLLLLLFSFIHCQNKNFFLPFFSTPAYDYAPNADKQWVLQVTERMEPIHKKFTDFLMTKRLQTLQSIDEAVERVSKVFWLNQNDRMKPCCHARACISVFKVNTLVWPNQLDFFENATACSKRMLKTRVATNFKTFELLNMLQLKNISNNWLFFK